MHKLLYASSHDGKEVQGSDMVAPISGGETAGIVCELGRILNRFQEGASRV
jgi:hypothetical protein